MSESADVEDVYFPESDWETLRRAETADEEGDAVLSRYSAIYKKNFLKASQDEEKVFLVEGTGGCRADPKSSVRIARSTPIRMTPEEVRMLSIF